MASYLDIAGKKVWSLLPSFWQAANGFDTWIDYLDKLKEELNKQGKDKKEIDLRMKHEVAGAFYFLESTWKTQLNSETGLNNVWFDDFGWWTIAAQKATTKSFFTNEQKAWLKDISSNHCWKRFNDNASHVWERAPTMVALHKAPLPYPDVKKVDWQPVVGGEDKRGVWNEYWWGTPDEFQGPKDGDPTGQTGDDQSHGVQNTVTNLVYLISAGRMGDKTAAEREHRFLSFWFSGPAKGTTPLLWRDPNVPNPDRALIRERVSHLMDENSVLKKAPGFFENAFWLGDQGLLIGALVDRIKANVERAASVKLIGAVLNGVVDRLVVKGELKNYVGGEGLDPFGRFEGDYRTGASVFWRYVLYAWDADKELQKVIDNSKIKPVLAASAEAAAGTKEPEVFADHFNDIAALVAAHAIRP
jgi:hypothetical protein